MRTVPLVALLGATLAACESTPAPVAGPGLLSQTGLYARISTRTLADGIVEVRPRFPLWSDGAEKHRYLRLPAGGQIDSSDMDAWRFPIGTQIWKEFSLDGRRIETRLLEKQRDVDDGGWFQMAYAWNDDESEAEAVPKGVRDARGTGYDIPAQHDCANCHYKGEKPVIGVSALQLSTTSDGSMPPIEMLASAGALTALPTRTYVTPGEGVVQAALGYLHANCSHCHDSRSAAAADVKVFMQLSVDDAVPEATQTYRSLVGQPIHHFRTDLGLLGEVVPGDAEHSLVHYRMARRDPEQMPPLATNRVDDAGLSTITAWIDQLAP